MTTEVAVKEKRGFKKPQAGIMPTLFCVGRIGKVENAKVSKSENYITVPMELMGQGAGRNQKFWFTFRPEWFSFDFDPSTLDGKAGYPLLVYSSNIANEKGLSVLEGLAGSNENFCDLCESLAALPFDENDEAGYLKAVTNVFKDFQNNVNPLIGYVLVQQTEKDGVDENGKTKYVRKNGYDVSFFYPTEEKIDQLTKKAEKSATQYNKAIEENKEIRERNKNLPEDQQEELVKVPKLQKITWDEEAPF